MSEKRWKAVAEYRSKHGNVDVDYDIEEIADLHDILEHGPDWNSLIKVTITLNRVTHQNMTVEEAEEL